MKQSLVVINPTNTTIIFKDNFMELRRKNPRRGKRIIKTIFIGVVASVIGALLKDWLTQHALEAFRRLEHLYYIFN